MSCKRALLIAATVVFILSSLPADGQAVEIYPEDKEYWDAYKAAKALGDDKEILRLSRRKRKNVAGVLDSLTTSFCQKEVPEEVEDFEYLAQIYSEIGGGKKYIHRLEYLKNLTHEQRNKRVVAGNDLYYGDLKFKEGKENDNVYAYIEAKDFYDKALAGYEEIGDTEMIATSASLLAQCCQNAKEHYAACVALSKALAAMEALPYSNPDEKWAKQEFDKYIAAGFDPTKPRYEGGEPEGGMPEGKPPGEGGEDAPGEGEAGGEAAKPETIEFAYEIIGQRQAWPLKYSEMKKPDEFVTPSYLAADQYFLWGSATIQGNDSQQFKPGGGAYPLNIYGKQVNVQRDKLKLTFDINADPSTKKTISIKDRPVDLSLKTADTDADGKRLSYKLFVCHPGSQEVQFSLNTNMAPVPEWIVVRCRVGCYYKGKVAGEKFVIIDDNTSGSYGDNQIYDRDGLTHGDFRYCRCDAVQVGKSKKADPWSQIMKLGDKWYFMDVDPKGFQVGTTEVKLETGTVRVNWEGGVKPTYLTLRCRDRNGERAYFEVMGDGKKPVEVPVGNYEIACGKIISGKKNKLKQIRIYNGNMEPIVVKPDEETVIELGAPFKYTWEAGPFGKDFVITGKSINVFGRSDAIFSSFWDEIPVPLVSIRTKEGKRSVVKKEEMSLATLDDWYANQSSAWHPMDFKYENKSGDALEVRLETKKHKILGGPILGDWK